MPLFLILIFALLLPAGVRAKQPTKRPKDEKRGETLYQQNCWQCHGKRGRGQGPLAQALGGKLKPIAQRYQTEEYPDLVKVILRGSGSMPGFDQVMNRADARRILVWLEDARISKKNKKKAKRGKSPKKRLKAGVEAAKKTKPNAAGGNAEEK
jgi:mono/diheme cytochrome c family protein